MTVQLFNTESLRNSVLDELDAILLKTRHEQLSQQDLASLLADLKVERKVLLDELDALRDERSNFQVYQSSKFNLLLDYLDEALYNDFVSLAVRLDRSPGELVNYLMQESVQHLLSAEHLEGDTASLLPDQPLDGLFPQRDTKTTISHQEQLTVSGADLKAMNGRVKFSHIDIIEFVDVDQQTFVDFVAAISHCDFIKLPDSIPKLIVYSKIHYCQSIGFYRESEVTATEIDYAKTANEVARNWNNGDTSSPPPKKDEK